jgi:membrane protein YdbS with pleckstrin-like domain
VSVGRVRNATTFGVVYPRRLLNDDETVVVDLHPHWWFLAAPIVMLLASIVFAVGVLETTDSTTTARSLGSWTGLGLLVFAALWLIVRSLRWLTSLFVITTSRVISRHGVLVKRTVEIPLERVSTVTSRQNLFERLVVVGDLTIESGNDRVREKFVDIRNPDRIKQVLLGLVTERRGGAVGLDVAGQLERFEGMLERGTLTPEEFAMQKRRLLDQL